MKARRLFLLAFFVEEEIKIIINDYLAILSETGKNPRTIKAHRQYLERFFQWLAIQSESADPLALKTIDGAQYRDYLLEKGNDPSYIKNILSCLESFCEWMRGEGFIDLNPMARVRRPAVSAALPRWLTPSERYRLIRTAIKEKDSRNTAIIFSLLFAGLTASELVNVTPKDVSLMKDRGYIKIFGKKPRVVPIPEKLVKCLRPFVQERLSSAWLFGSQREEQLSYTGLYQICSSIGNKAKIEGVSPQILRHTYCRELIKDGVSLNTLSKLVGVKVNNLTVYLEEELKMEPEWIAKGLKLIASNK